MALRELIITIRAVSDIKGVKKLEAAHKEMTSKIKSQLASIRSVSKVSFGSMFRSARQSISKMTNAYVAGVDAMSKKIGRFRMEFLGLMFFGMQIYRVFSKFFRSMLEGYIKITRAQTAIGRQVTALTAQWTFFRFAIIEAMEPSLVSLIGTVMNVLEWLSALSPATKSMIGWFILASAAIGGFLMVLGQVSLGVSSLLLWFGGLYGVLAEGGIVIAGTTVALSTLLGAIGLVTAAAVLLYLAWTRNWFGIREKTYAAIDDMKRAIGPWIEKLKAIWEPFCNFLNAIWSGSWEDIKEASVAVLTAIWEFIKETGRLIWDFVVWMGRTTYDIICSILRKLRERIITIFGGVWEDVKKKIVDFFNWLVGHSYLQDQVNNICKVFTDLKERAIVIWVGFKDKIVSIVYNMVTLVKNKFLELKRSLDNTIDYFKRHPIVKTVTTVYRTVTQRIPSFQYGGVVPGPIGAPVPIIAHGGERFLGPSTAFGNINVNVNVPAISSAVDETRAGEIIGEAIRYKLSRLQNVGGRG